MSIKQLSKISTAILLAAGLAACAHNTGNDMTSSTALTAYHWQMEQAVDANGQTDTEWLRAEGLSPASLLFADDTLSVGGLCNTMVASYTLEGSTIDISAVDGTIKMCADEEQMSYEKNFGKRLPDVATWQVNESLEAPSLILGFDNGDAWTLKGIPTAETKYGSTGETIFLEVASETKPCSHPLINNFQCLQVRTINYDEQGLKQGQGEWQNFYDNIENYQHRCLSSKLSDFLSC